MRKISDELKEKIEDAQLEGWTTLPPQILEKDIHVTDALHAISGIEWHSSANPHKKGEPFKAAGKLVFAGGTCLSKAYGLIERMSEDIDIKVFLEEIPEEYKAISIKSRLKTLHGVLVTALTGIGFTAAIVDEQVDEDESDVENAESKKRLAENPHIRDARRFFHLTLDYKSAFDGELGALRPNIKVELIHRHTQLPSQQKTFGYLVDKIIGIEPTQAVTMDCISIEETLAEKVLSMLRRTAWKWYGGQAGAINDVLVRHIYDVGRICSQHPDAVTAACTIFPALVAVDGKEFSRQYPEFAATPREILMKSLARLATDEEIASNYEEKLQPLIYGESRPDYAEAYARFAQVANDLLATLKH